MQRCISLFQKLIDVINNIDLIQIQLKNQYKIQYQSTSIFFV